MLVWAGVVGDRLGGEDMNIGVWVGTCGKMNAEIDVGGGGAGAPWVGEIVLS